MATFTIRLAEAYYNQGIINPGAAASRHLGAHNEPITVNFSDSTRPVASRIDRIANPGGYVRVVGGNGQIRDWFQTNFAYGDLVQARVLNRNAILLLHKAATT